MTQDGPDDPDGGFDRVSEEFFREGEEMEDAARMQSILHPSKPWWKRALYGAFFAGLLTGGAGMAYQSIDRVVETSRLEQALDAERRRRDTLRGELDAIRYQAGIIEEDGTLISRLPMTPSDLEMLTAYCDYPMVSFPRRASTQRLYQSVVEVDVQFSNGEPGSGSGVILTQNGYVVTAHHVIDDFVSGVVRTHDGREYRIVHPIVISSPRHDLTIIKIDRDGPAQAVQYNRDFVTPSVGMEVFVFGFYEGMPFNQIGHVTDAGRDARYDNLLVEDTALTSAYVQRGFSGGAVVRADDGALIGITTYATFHPFQRLDSAGYPSGFVPLSGLCAVLQDYLSRQEAGLPGSSQE